MTYAKIRQLIRCVNRLREPALRMGKYTLVSQSSVRLVLMLPKEFNKSNKTVARGVLAIEQYLRDELAELEYLITDEHEAKEYVL